MKVLMLNGSPNADGSTRIGLEELAQSFAQEDISSEIVHVGAKPVRDCIGCGRCGELGRCAFEDDAVNDFTARAGEADGFIFATPVYYAHPTGQIQSFLDRAFFSSARMAGGGPFHHKPGAAVAVARRAGTTAALDVLGKYFGISGMITAGSSYWNEIHALDPADVPFDHEGLQTLRNLARNLAWLMRSLEAGRQAGIAVPETERQYLTNFIR